MITVQEAKQRVIKKHLDSTKRTEVKSVLLNPRSRRFIKLKVEVIK